jgi:hypothetical protein
VHEIGLRDSEVLGVIEEEDLARFTFEGLKRRMGAHPQTLSRTLERLEEQNILERRAGGYQLTDKGRGMVNVHPLSSDRARIQLVRTLLPPTVPFEALVPSLEGKWFGELRWLGQSNTPSEVALKWITADGKVQLDAIFAQGELRIEGTLLRGDDVAEAIRASHQLMSHISKEYLKPYHGRALMYRGARPISFMPN